ncbi:hypothetical protein INT47_006900 [Mucor saturninus]|uniref:Uncharacterized protein n=1 Tax=Mucor saturninus TaxID=64648 RepID=A0A8H7USS8_9FUNG|nr:hypothetical protein INT47_006900 [Mucor saturninus]
MTALTAKLEALDLHQLIPLIDSNETTHENVKQSMAESWKTDKDDYYFDNDAASPAEGYYIFRRQYEQDNRPRNNYNDYYNNRNSYHPSGKRPHAYNQYHDHKEYPQPSYNNQRPYIYSDNAHQGQPPSNYNSQQKGYQYQPGPPSNQNSHANNEPMDTDTYDAPGPSALLTQPYQPIAPKAPILTNQAINLPTRENIIHNIESNGDIVNNIKNNKTKIRRKITPLSERIAYDITEDVLNRKADINDQDQVTNLKTRTMKYTYAAQDKITPDGPINSVESIIDNDLSDDSDSDLNESSEESDELVPESSDEESVNDLYILEDTYGEIRKISHKKDIIYMEDNPDVPDNYLIKLQSAIYLSPYSKTSFTIKPMNLSVSQMEETKFMLFITNDKLHDRNSTWQPASSYLAHYGDVITIYLINNSDSIIELSSQEIIGELDVLNIDDIAEMDCYKVRKYTAEDLFHMEEVHNPPQKKMENKRKDYKPGFKVGDIVKLYRNNISTSWSGKIMIRWYEDNYCIQENLRKGANYIKHISNPDDTILKLKTHMVSIKAKVHKPHQEGLQVKGAAKRLEDQRTKKLYEIKDSFYQYDITKKKIIHLEDKKNNLLKQQLLPYLKEELHLLRLLYNDSTDQYQKEQKKFLKTIIGDDNKTTAFIKKHLKHI